MPPQQAAKKKGKAPAHQNTFAYAHNPKSKKTDTILASPNTHVCRRCHEKIEWRKQFRKYKPRTNLGKCNLCSKKNVNAAYHTICEQCSRKAPKVVALLAELNLPRQAKQRQGKAPQEEKDAGKQDDEGNNEGEDTVDKPETIPVAQDEEVEVEESGGRTNYRRVCAVCVKEPALLDGDEVYDDEEDPLGAGGRRLKLREIKTIQRHALSASQPKRKKKEHENGDDDDGENSDNEQGDNAAGPESGEARKVTNMEVDNDEEEDPFLAAVGGADKLLFGEAYQAMLLQRAQAESK
jgi:hypothetical protein